MDTFPYDSWAEATTAAQENGEAFYTFGPGGNTASIILTILGCILMVASIVAWVVTEKYNLKAHAARHLKEGLLDSNG